MSRWTSFRDSVTKPFKQVGSEVKRAGNRFGSFVHDTGHQAEDAFRNAVSPKDSWLYGSENSVLWGSKSSSLKSMFKRSGAVGKAYNQFVSLGEDTGDLVGIKTQTTTDRERNARDEEARAIKAAKDAEAKAVLDATVAAGQDALSRKRSRTASMYRPLTASDYTLGSGTRLGS